LIVVSVLLALTVGLSVACAGAAFGAAWPAARDGARTADVLRGTGRPDYLRGLEGPDRLSGFGGADLLMGGTGGDRISGGSGDDTVTGAAGGDRVTGGPGEDVVSGGFGGDTIDGGAGDDTLNGDNDHDVITGGAGDDVIHGGSGPDILDGGDGADVLYGDSGGDLYLGGAGDDVLYSDVNTQSIVDCGPGNDTLFILASVDQMWARYPRTVVNCERLLVVDAATDPHQGRTYLAAPAGGKVVGTSKDDLLLGGAGRDILIGEGGNDVLWGFRLPEASAAPDYLDGGPGEDTIYGGPGPQRIFGGPGKDFINGGLGRNVIHAGSGEDTIRLRGAGTADVYGELGDDAIYVNGAAAARVRCGAGRDVVHANRGDAIAADCERVIAQPGSRPRRLRDAGDGLAPSPVTAALVIVPLNGALSPQLAMGSSDPAATFQCALAGDPAQAPAWTPCTTGMPLPDDRRVVVRVRAVNGAGVADPTPLVLDMPPRAQRGMFFMLPAFGAATANVYTLDDGGAYGTRVEGCHLDAQDLSCIKSNNYFSVNRLRPGTHEISALMKPTDTTTPILVTTALNVGASATSTAIALQFPATIEAGASLASRVPRVRFVLESPGTLALTITAAEGRQIARSVTTASYGADAVKVPGTALRKLRLGRYTLTITASGADGQASSQHVAFAVIPRTR
jgi:hypothetical protein